LQSGSAKGKVLHFRRSVELMLVLLAPLPLPFAVSLSITVSILAAAKWPQVLAKKNGVQAN